MNFKYLTAESISDALRLKREYRERASFIAGGTDFLVNLRNKNVGPQVLIDISNLKEINFIKEENGRMRIGACTTVYEIQKSPSIQKNSAILYDACRGFANPLIKNKATIGGNLVNASPAADMAPPLLVLDAEAVIQNSDGERTINLEDFFTGVKKTRLENDEMLREISFEKQGDRTGAFLKIGQRAGPSISIASLTVLANFKDEKILDPKIALGSVAPTPMRARKTEKLLNGNKPTPELIKKASDSIKKEISPISDVRGSSEYRREVCGRLLEKALRGLFQIEEVE